MTDTPYLRLVPQISLYERLSPQIDSEAEALLALASQLGPRDLSVLSQVIRRTVHICETEGEEIALAVLDQLMAIVQNRPSDA